MKTQIEGTNNVAVTDEEQRLEVNATLFSGLSAIFSGTPEALAVHRVTMRWRNVA
jgi:hypothetical protein